MLQYIRRSTYTWKKTSLKTTYFGRSSRNFCSGTHLGDKKTSLEEDKRISYRTKGSPNLMGFSEEESERYFTEKERVEDKNIVKLSGLSQFANRNDINRLLRCVDLELDPINIRLAHTPYLRLKGEWFVILDNVSQENQLGELIVQHQKSPVIGGGGIDLQTKRISPEAYLQATRFFPYQNDGTSVLMYNLPYKISEDMIHRFFYDFFMHSDGITIGKHPDSPLKNMCRVRFMTSDEASRAVRDKNGRPLNATALEVRRYEG